MNIRTLLRDAAEATDPNDVNMIDMEYEEQSLTLSDNTVIGGGGKVKITYIKSMGYFSAVSTKYTQTEQPFIPKTGAADVTGDLINSKAYAGGFKIEDRPLIGSDDTTTN